MLAPGPALPAARASTRATRTVGSGRDARAHPTARERVAAMAATGTSIRERGTA